MNCYSVFSQQATNASSSLSLTPKGSELEGSEVKATLEDQFFHNAIIVEFLLSAGVCVALGLLGVWHAKLISQVCLVRLSVCLSVCLSICLSASLLFAFLFCLPLHLSICLPVHRLD